MMTEQDLDAIEERCDRATPGPWYWQSGKHTDNVKTAEPGGIYTQTPSTRFRQDGSPFKATGVIYPVAVVGGDQYWLDRFQKARTNGRPTLTIALECLVCEEDKQFIIQARDDVSDLVAEVRRLRQLVADRPSQ